MSGWSASDEAKGGGPVPTGVDNTGERASARETGPALEAQGRFLLRIVPAIDPGFG